MPGLASSALTKDFTEDTSEAAIFFVFFLKESYDGLLYAFGY